MRTASLEMAHHLHQEVVTLATLWRITRTDGEVFSFTDHDNIIDLDDASVSWGSPSLGGVFTPAIGYSRSAIKESVDLSVDNLEVIGIVDGSVITESDLRSGRFDRALIEIGLVNFEDLSMGVIYIRRGYFGEVQIRDDAYIVQLNGLTQLLNNEIGGVFTGECTADLGDTKCTIDLETDSTQDGNTIKRTGGTIASVTNAFVFTATLNSDPTVSSHFDEGLLVWTGTPDTDNLNGGLRVEIDTHVKSGATHTFTLLLPARRQMTVGDTFTAYAGCNRHVDHCRDRFGAADGRGNIRNYRGFPHVTVFDRFLQIPNRLLAGIGL